MKEKLIYQGASNDLGVFERRVKKAKECGFTHVEISRLTDRSRWEQDDPKDPWLHWHMGNCSFFRIIVPDGLKDFVPPETARENIELMTAKGKILEKYGLKAFFSSWDPTWLPESFFKINPDWRGPRIDHPRRSVHKRFAACMDHPGVLALYRETVRKLVSKIPSIDTIALYSNDSGAGMCWSEYLYNGKNGPAHCADISIGKRIAKFLNEIRNGALDAGVEAEVTISAQFSSTEADSISSEVLPGTGLMDWNVGNFSRGHEVMKKLLFVPAQTPFYNIPFYQSLSNIQESVRTAKKILTSIPSSFEDTHYNYLDMIQEMLNMDTYTVLDRNALLYKMAVRQAGEENAADLMKVWELIDTGVSVFSIPRRGGQVFALGAVMQRWITRPLVPFPLELTEDEKGYYRKHQFQAKGDESAADMMNCQDTYLIDSRCGALYFEQHWSSGKSRLSEACSLLEKIAVKLPNCERKEEFITLVYTLKALRCLAQTCINVCTFQTFMYEFTEPEQKPIEKPYDMGDYERQFIYGVYRSEIDNTREFIGLLNNAPRNILATAQTEEKEDVMTLSPNIVSQLEKKIDIMMNHWQDFDRIFPRPNK